MEKIKPKFQKIDVDHVASMPMPTVFEYMFEPGTKILGLQYRPDTGQIDLLIAGKKKKKTIEAVEKTGIAIKEMKMPTRLQDILELHFYSVEDMQGKNLSMYKGIGKVSEKAILKRMEELLG